MPIKGESVIVEHKGEATEDAMGGIIYGEAVLETVENVIVQIGSSDDNNGSNRPDGVIVAYTLHFPKTWNKSVRGLRIKVRGRWCDVIGDPDYYNPENTPTQWNYPVEVKRSDG